MGTTCKVSENNWKKKTLLKSKVVKSLKKECHRQCVRANKWRLVAQLSAKSLKLCELLVSKAEASLLALQEQSGGVLVESVSEVQVDRVLPQYHYPLSVIWLCVILYKNGLSFRATCAVLPYISDFSGFKLAVPHHTTVRRWVYEVGLWLLEKGGQYGGNWGLIVDESYSLGDSQLLLVLGVKLDELRCGEAICLQDVVPLAIEVRQKWTGDDVGAVLERVAQKVSGEIHYVVSDRGNNLTAAYKAGGLPHLPDWGHYAANILEQTYAKSPDFKLFNEKMGAFKCKRKQSKFHAYSPPNLSVKVRFMNYIPFLEWANLMKHNFAKIPSEIRPELQFICDLSPLIEEATALFYCADTLGTHLKAHGITTQSIQNAKVMLLSATQNLPPSDNITHFKQGLATYFAAALDLRNNVQQKTKCHPKSNIPIIASSDIIESIFGIFKNRAPNDPKRGFTQQVLLIPLIINNLSPSQVYNSLIKKVKNSLHNWASEHIVTKKYITFRNVFS